MCLNRKSNSRLKQTFYMLHLNLSFKIQLVLHDHLPTPGARIRRCAFWELQFVPHIRLQTATLYSQIGLQTKFRGTDRALGVLGVFQSFSFIYGYRLGEPNRTRRT